MEHHVSIVPSRSARRPALRLIGLVTALVTALAILWAGPGTSADAALPGAETGVVASEVAVGVRDGMTLDARLALPDGPGPRSPAIRTAPAVRVAVRGPAEADVAASDLFTQYRWEQGASPVTGTYVRKYLGSGELSSSPINVFKTLRDGVNVLLTNGVPMYQGEFEVLSGKATTVPLDLVDHGVTEVWRGPESAAVSHIRGNIAVRLALTRTSCRDRCSSMRWTRHDVRRRARALLVDGCGAGCAAPDLPAGHRFGLAVSTGDVLHSSRPGSFVDVPVR